MRKQENIKKQESRRMRHSRVRAIVQGTAARPRLSVFRSLKYVQAQLIDDASGKTIAGLTSKGLPIDRAPQELTAKQKAAYAAGFALAEAAQAKGITQAVFDRGGYAYHGRVKAAADGARAGGLTF